MINQINMHDHDFTFTQTGFAQYHKETMVNNCSGHVCRPYKGFQQFQLCYTKLNFLRSCNNEMIECTLAFQIIVGG